MLSQKMKKQNCNLKVPLSSAEMFSKQDAGIVNVLENEKNRILTLKRQSKQKLSTSSSVEKLRSFYDNQYEVI